MGTMSHYNVKVAAEAFAAALFAQAGYDVSVQYGADQPEYDLIVGKRPKLMKVSVKGSQQGKWGLAQSFLRGANYFEAIDKWQLRHDPATVICLVQFKDVHVGQCPRVYLARPEEVARQLKKARCGHGSTILRENHAFTERSVAAGTIDRIPESWLFKVSRVEELIV